MSNLETGRPTVEASGSSHGDEAMNRIIYDRLRRVARSRSVTTYQEVAALVGRDVVNAHDRSWLNAKLDTISTFEVERGHPMLSVVTINARHLIPGPGFFALAERLGRLRRNEHQIVFFARELMNVHYYWGQH